MAKGAGSGLGVEMKGGGNPSAQMPKKGVPPVPPKMPTTAPTTMPKKTG